MRAPWARPGCLDRWIGHCPLSADPLCLLGVAALFMTTSHPCGVGCHHSLTTSHTFAQKSLALSVWGFFINSLPLRVGEVVRPFYFKTGTNPARTWICHGVCEQVIDLAAMLIMIGVVAWVVDVPTT